jgi:hypothetical protein
VVAKVARISAANSFRKANRQSQLAFLIWMTLDQPIRRIKTSHGIYVLLIVANIMMGTVVMEQGRVIENQRVLIKALFYDNIHMATAKFKHAVARK